MIENLLPLFIMTTLETKRNLFHYVTQLLFLDYNSDASLIKSDQLVNQQISTAPLRALCQAPH